MGFRWSKPKSPLKQPLLEDAHPYFLRTGDLLLVATYDLDSFDNLWTHVALVVSPTKIYSYGQIISTDVFMKEYDCISVRQLNCQRPVGFEKKFVDAVASSMAQSYRVVDEYKEGFEIGHVLYKMGFMQEIEELRPCHFSISSEHISLDMYSKHLYL